MKEESGKRIFKTGVVYIVQYMEVNIGNNREKRFDSEKSLNLQLIRYIFNAKYCDYFAQNSRTED